MFYQVNRYKINIFNMDKLSQISLENNVSIKVDCFLNQELLSKNFGIIMECLKDLKGQADKNTDGLNSLTGLKELVEKLKNQFIHSKTHISIQDKKDHISEQSTPKKQDQNLIGDLSKQINQLKERISKNEEFTKENTADINLLAKDINQSKKEIEALKKLLQDLKGSNGAQETERNLKKNLSKNENLLQQSINSLNNQSQQYGRTLHSLQKQVQQMKNLIKKHEDEINELKFNSNQPIEDKKMQELPSNNITGVSVEQILKKIQFLTKKTQNIQSQVLSNTQCINDVKESTQKNKDQIDQQKQNVDQLNLQMEQVNRILQQLQKVHNDDNDNLLQQIQKLKLLYEKLLKVVNGLKNQKSEGTISQDRINGMNGSSKNINKNRQQNSFRRRSESIDHSGKLKEHQQRIKYLEKHLGEDNPEKLPAIGFKKPNQTSYNGQKSHKKQMADLKNELEIWIKSYVDAHSKGFSNLADLQLKIQEIKNILARKADQQGMKKGLAFLQGKVTQLYLFLTEPESEDAMIVRKGFNCLSCSKKVENLRGKLGPRMNWDNLNGTHHNNTPPKSGFPKYADSNDKESI